MTAGHNVVVVKNGRRICGSGAALANAPVAQNKACLLYTSDAADE